MDYIAEVAKEIIVIIMALTAIGGLVYWVLKTKLKEEVLQDYCLKNECQKKHDDLDKALLNSNNAFKEEFREIKETVMEIRKMLFDFISKK